MRILVVDDDPSVAQMIAEAIRSFGHEGARRARWGEGLRVLESTAVQGSSSTSSCRGSAAWPFSPGSGVAILTFRS
jgi:CheY-like chemotaxis protein